MKSRGERRDEQDKMKTWYVYVFLAAPQAGQTTQIPTQVYNIERRGKQVDYKL